ncbi:7TM diverse intracellular signaling domain-containing protein [Hymenobacter latericus]|uniref:7TM diverse intracellular signaling domain-containing protein n=1 Tax=Hymenobacter sp. YIM 151858-1 TaxID=2987688 RepID=UPI0022268A0C|nr:7TM diverse intracellular signaling domain-containing protein [Hymenobacter sp. YIM 151858-1]UYZ57789.1 response regulator [Hymenobacter sp. YIM 151858-1]
MKYLLLGVYLCLSTTWAAAAPRPGVLVVEDTARVYQLRTQGSVLATSQPLSLAQVRSASWHNRFAPATQAAGAPTATELWWRFNITSVAHPATHWVLSTNTEYMDGLDVYVVPANGQVQHQRMSTALPHKQTHALRTRYFNLGLSLPPGQVVTVYLRAPAQQVVYPTLAEQAHLLQQYREADWAMGPYFGILLALLAYNLLLYVSVRDRSYLLYVLYVGFFAALQFDMTGYWRQVWPNNWSGFALDMRQNLVLACTIFFGTLTARAFLDSWRLLPRFDKVLKLTLLVAWLPLASGFFANPNHAIWWQALPALWTCVVLLAAGVLVLRTGYRPARYYMAGWTLLLVAVANFYLGLLGITPRTGFWAAHGVHVASALEMLLLSFGFADRINLAKHDKELAQEAAMHALQQKEAAQSQALAALRETQRAQEVALVLSREKEELQERTNHELAERAAELQHAYQELHESIRTSHHLQELDELKTKFFTNISHELRTPLTLIISPLEQLLSEAQQHPRLPAPPEYALMLRNARRLLQLINQLLDIARLEAGQMHLGAAPADMVRTVRTGVSSFESLAVSHGVALRFETELESLEVYLDADQFDKILYNLLGNAFKFTPAGGEVLVSVGQQAGRAVLRVQDTGVGIPAEHVPLIFDRFHQVDDTHTRRHEGSGIGLALVKELVALHHGNIRVLSALGEGTTFVVELPLGKAHLQPNELRAAAAASATGLAAPLPDFIDQPDTNLPVAPADARPLVLVVEDNPEVRDYIRTCLAAEFRVRTANDGAHGLALLKDLEPDLVVSDLMMPQLDGLELCRRLRADEHTSHIPVILLTARAGDEARLTSFGLGADEYLTKPFHPEELRVRIHNLVQQRRLLRQRFGREVTLQPRDISITSADETFLNRAMGVVEQHMADTGFSVERFADEMAMSRVQLHRKLKALTDQSTSEFVRTVRLRRAAVLLQAHAGNVAEVAEAVGFANLSYFSKCFRELYQQSPSEYAAQAITTT